VIRATSIKNPSFLSALYYRQSSLSASLTKNCW